MWSITISGNAGDAEAEASVKAEFQAFVDSIEGVVYAGFSGTFDEPVPDASTPEPESETPPLPFDITIPGT